MGDQANDAGPSREAEGNLAWLRAGMVAIVGVVYIFFWDRASVRDGLASVVIVLAAAYALPLAILSRRLPLELRSVRIGTAAVDSVFGLAFVFAFGPFENTFYTLLFAMVVAYAFRFDVRTTVVASASLLFLYVAMIAAVGQLAANAVDVAVRVLFLAVVAGISAALAQHSVRNRQAQQAMQQRVDAANRAESRFRAVVAAAPDAILISNRAGRIVLANKQAERMFGYDRVDLVGSPVEMLVPKELRAVHTEHRANYYENPQVREMGQGQELAATRKDGTTFPIEVSLSPLDTDEGLLVTSVIRDLTPMKDAALELERRALDLERSNRDLEQFAYVASHDLQEPLRMVGGYVQLLARRYQDALDDEAEEFIGYAVEGVKRMQALIDDLLAFSRVGTKAQPMYMVDASEAVEDALRSLGPSINEAGARVEVGDMPSLVADKGQLAQLFQNLIGNAVKFRGDEPPRVVVGCIVRDEVYEFFVRDNGPGIRPEDREKVFVIFQRLNEGHGASGTGIGLAICKRIVERHGGSIWVESSQAPGAEFRFSIPKRELPEPEAPTSGRPPGPPPRGPRELI